MDSFGSSAKSTVLSWFMLQGMLRERTFPTKTSSEIVQILLQTIATTFYLYIMFNVLKFHAHGSFFATNIYNIYKQYNRTSWAFKENYTIYFFVCLLMCYNPIYE